MNNMNVIKETAEKIVRDNTNTDTDNTNHKGVKNLYIEFTEMLENYAETLLSPNSSALDIKNSISGILGITSNASTSTVIDKAAKEVIDEVNASAKLTLKHDITRADLGKKLKELIEYFRNLISEEEKKAKISSLRTFFLKLAEHADAIYDIIED